MYLWEPVSQNQRWKKFIVWSSSLRRWIKALIEECSHLTITKISYFFVSLCPNSLLCSSIQKHHCSCHGHTLKFYVLFHDLSILENVALLSSPPPCTVESSSSIESYSSVFKCVLVQSGFTFIKKKIMAFDSRSSLFLCFLSSIHFLIERFVCRWCVNLFISHSLQTLDYFSINLLRIIAKIFNYFLSNNITAFFLKHFLLIALR